jgi:hypothetical protein
MWLWSLCGSRSVLSFSLSTNKFYSYSLYRNFTRNTQFRRHLRLTSYIMADQPDPNLSKKLDKKAAKQERIAAAKVRMEQQQMELAKKDKEEQPQKEEKKIRLREEFVNTTVVCF